MNPKKNNLPPIAAITAFLISLAILLTGCQGEGEGENPTTPGIYKPPTPAPAISPTPPKNPTPTTTSSTCKNHLIFVDDVTIPDGTEVRPGEILVKQWQVENTGSCNWQAGYTMQIISGPDLGASHNLALYPARKETQPILEITFTAPKEPGRYTSMWQAHTPQGEPFGQAFYIEVVVAGE